MRFDQSWLARWRVARVARPIPDELWLIGAVIAVAAAIRILTIDNQSFWTDEALTAYEAGLSFGGMLKTVAHVETTPPLYFILIWGWAKVFGSSEVALRSVSTLAGIALVPLAYLSARELVSRRAGLIAAALVAVNPFLVWYSQEARAYMLLAALTGAAFLWFIRARRDPSARNLTWWAMCSSLAVMTHFFAGFAIAPEALWLLWLSRSNARLRTGIAVAVVALAQVGMAPFAFVDTSHGPGWIAAIPRGRRIEQLMLEWGVDLLTRRIALVYGVIGGAIVIGLAALLLVGGERRARAGAGVAAVVAACVFLIPLALGLVGQDYFYVRNEIPAFVPLATVIAAACVAPRARLFGNARGLPFGGALAGSFGGALARPFGGALARPIGGALAALGPALTLLGGALAAALLALFCYSTFTVQTISRLQRPQWASVSRALGSASVPRAILAAGGEEADPLKLYLPGVSWVQVRARPELVTEIDVVGVRRMVPVVSPGQDRTNSVSAGAAQARGAPVPRSLAPAGARLVSRFQVHNWIVARFALVRPALLSIDQLSHLAPEFMRHTPKALLIFVQRPQG